MNNASNVTIVLLGVTAAILAGLLVGAWQDRTAQAGYAPDSKGDYVAIPYTWNGDMDLLIVVDVASRKLNVYNPNLTTKGLDLKQTVDIDRLFAD